MGCLLYVMFPVPGAYEYPLINAEKVLRIAGREGARGLASKSGETREGISGASTSTVAPTRVAMRMLAEFVWNMADTRRAGAVVVAGNRHGGEVR